MNIHALRNLKERSKRTGAAGIIGMGGAALLIGGLAISMPGVAFVASLRGVKVWWEVLFPALFPFFVVSELLLGFGIVHLAGTLLDPLMKPLFRIPGAGGFVVAMGFASGYPVGARLTSRLMEQNLVNREQGERLVEMTTTSDPIFLIGAVCVGFFGNPEAVPVLALAHYGGAMLLGLANRWRGKQEDSEHAPGTQGGRKTNASPKRPPGGRVRAALTAMHRARKADGRPFGVMLLQSVQSSLSLMVIVGGLVVFFSAALDLLLNSGTLVPLREAAGLALHLAGMPGRLDAAVIQGTFEVTLGARGSAEAASGTELLPLVDRLAAAAFVLSWAGLSVHAQVAGLMSRTGWRYAPFVRFRLLHGILAAAIVYLAWPFLPATSTTLMPAWLDLSGAARFERAMWPPAAAAAVIAVIATAGSAALVMRKLLHSLGLK